MSQINRDQEGDFIYNFAGNFQTKLFMNEIGTKIRELRKKKGFSQEELAESACVSLRTVQRIENDENEPRGNTMQQICKVLGVNAEEILDYGKQTDPRYLLCFHLSVLSFLVIPLGNIILPMILWQSRKENIVGLREAGIKLLNYQIVWTVCLSLSVIVLTLLKIQHVGYFSSMFYFGIGLYVLNIILPVYFAFRSGKGRTDITYPAIVRLIK